MGKIKSFMSKHKKKLTISLMTTALTVFSALSCAAEEVGAGNSNAMESALTEFTSALTNVQDDIMMFIVAAIPTGLAVFGCVIAITKGIGFVKKLLGKAT